NKTPHSTKHDDGEGDQYKGLSNPRVHVEKRQQQTGCGTDAGGTDAKADREYSVDIDTDQLASSSLFFDPPTPPAEITVCPEQRVRGEDDVGRTKSHRLRDGDIVDE